MSDETVVWPLRVVLAAPQEAQGIVQLERVERWIAGWRTGICGGNVIWRRRKWRAIGTHDLPTAVEFSCSEDIASLIGKGDEWRRVNSRIATLRRIWPEWAVDWSRFCIELIEFDEINFHAFINVVQWLRANPNSDLYMRQIPVVGIDSKWLERHRGIINKLAGPELAALATPPRLIRMRILDEALRCNVGGLSDFSASVKEIARLSIAPQAVMVVENLQSGLAIPDIPGLVVLMGLGYHVKVLCQIPWVQNACVYYWGDIDTHGLSILNEARAAIPHLTSMMMGESVLLAHKELWTEEKSQMQKKDLPSLTASELGLLNDLQEHRFGINVRLEQERIPWGFVVAAVAGLANTSNR